MEWRCVPCVEMSVRAYKIAVLIALALTCASAPDFSLASPAAAGGERHERDKRVELLGLRIGDSEVRVRAILSPVAVFQREDEGQLVWRFRKDADTRFALIGLDRERRVRYITALAGESGAFGCVPLREGTDIVRTGGEGNLDMRRTMLAGEDQVIVIAKGTSAQHLTSCSIKKAGSSMEQEEEAERGKH